MYHLCRVRRYLFCYVVTIASMMLRPAEATQNRKVCIQQHKLLGNTNQNTPSVYYLYLLEHVQARCCIFEIRKIQPTQ